MRGNSVDRKGPLKAMAASYEMTCKGVTENSFNLHVLEELINSGEIDQEIGCKIKLCFQEALTNSLDHGNLELESRWKEELDEDGIDRYAKERQRRLDDPEYANKLLFITSNFDGVELAIKIKDQGHGFDFTKERKELRDNKDNHGRGLYIMHEIMDQIVFSKGGTEVLMIKRIEKK